MDLLKKLGKGKISIVIGSAIGALSIVALIVFNLSKPTMGLLYGDLSQEDVSNNRTSQA